MPMSLYIRNLSDERIAINSLGISLPVGEGLEVGISNEWITGDLELAELLRTNKIEIVDMDDDAKEVMKAWTPLINKP